LSRLSVEPRRPRLQSEEQQKLASPHRHLP
jgi:hypothetical protein